MIKGKKETIDYINQAGPGNKSIYVNMEAINELPDEYEAIISEIKFNPNKLDENFSNVGSKDSPSWMPQPSIMYKIAEARGISGLENQNDEPLIEDVNINQMLCKPLEDAPVIRKMTIGRKVTKTSQVMQDDGTMRTSSPCTVIYNVWDRCCEAWSSEEKWTNGYTKKGKYPNRYENKFDRQLHFQTEMKFAHAKAETKAYEKTIRELAGLMTGYSTEDLSSGKLIFARIRRSSMALKTEQAARLAAISTGTKPVTNLLFDDTKDTKPLKLFEEPKDEIHIIAKTEKEKILDRFESIKNIPADMQESVNNCIAWINSQSEPEKSESYWNKSLSLLQTLEEN